MGRYYNSQQKVYIWWRQEVRCGDCGERVAANEQYHHILNWKDRGITSIDNSVMLCKSCHDSSHNNARFRDSIMLSHNDFKYGNFSKSGESEYSRTRLEIKNEIEKLSYINVSENFFQEQKQVKNDMREIIL